jgi:signal transduction histidine kinase
MGGVRWVAARLTGVLAARPQVADCVVAAGLTAGGLAGLALPEGPAPMPVAIACCAIATTTVAWRRRAPLLAPVAALAAALAYRHPAHDQAGIFQLGAMLLDFYMAGRLRSGPGSRRWQQAAVVACVCAGLAGIAGHGGTFSWFQLAEAGVPVVVLPVLTGRLVARRSALTRQQAQNTERLEIEQELRVAAAAADERSYVARELHDVVAHSVSVMVIQAGAARLTAEAEPAVAREALAVVLAAGREALTDLRRIMGVVRRDEAQAGPPRGLDGLRSLVERVSASGLPAELAVEGDMTELPREIDLVAYRIVQEALTNAVKHAGPARARVLVSYRPDAVSLTITDTGSGSSASQPPPQWAASGQGLPGMRERVSRCGGTLHAGDLPGGGFEIRAEIPVPVARATSAAGAAVPGPPAAAGEATGADPGTGGPERTGWRERVRRPWRWRDEVFVVVLLIALEGEVFLSADRRGPLALNVVLTAAMAVAAAFRRRWPLPFLVAVNLLAVPLSGGLTSIAKMTIASTYVFAVPTYTVAAWSARSRAIAGLLVAVCVPATLGPYWHVGVSAIIGDVLLTCAVWAAGRIIRAQRTLAADVESSSAQLLAERDERERLAIARERTRMVRDLHALVAQGVVTMVVQAEAISGRLSDDPSAAARALAGVEHAGRQALVQMRGILGLLRARDEPAERAPAPGLTQIHALVRSARAAGHRVTLAVTGEPGPLLGGTDIAAYRIVEDALGLLTESPDSDLTITMAFGRGQLSLDLSGHQLRPRPWPSSAVSARIAQCDGQIGASWSEDAAAGLSIRLPRNLEAAFA